MKSEMQILRFYLVGQICMYNETDKTDCHSINHYETDYKLVQKEEVFLTTFRSDEKNERRRLYSSITCKSG